MVLNSVDLRLARSSASLASFGVLSPIGLIVCFSCNGAAPAGIGEAAAKAGVSDGLLAS